MAKYSYYCNVCGHTFLSDSKEAVKKERDRHRPMLLIPGSMKMRGPCVDMMRNKRGEQMRESLVNHQARQIVLGNTEGEKYADLQQGALAVTGEAEGEGRE